MSASWACRTRARQAGEVSGPPAAAARAEACSASTALRAGRDGEPVMCKGFLDSRGLVKKTFTFAAFWALLRRLPAPGLPETRFPDRLVQYPRRGRQLPGDRARLTGCGGAEYPGEHLPAGGQAVPPGDLEPDGAPLGGGERRADQRQAVLLFVGQVAGER